MEKFSFFADTKLQVDQIKKNTGKNQKVIICFLKKI